MNKIGLFVFSLFAIGLPCSVSSFAIAQETDEHAAIHSTVRSYVAAFNRGDAQAIAEHFSQTGHWVTPTGDRIEGRDAIQAEMEAYFADGGRPHVEVFTPVIRLLSDTVAMEEGRARVTRNGELPSDTTYIAIHVKPGDAWKLDSIRETAVPVKPSNYEHLRELDWLVGEWVDLDDSGSIETQCAWTKNRNFLTRSFAVKINDQIELEGTQIIGWDAANQSIRSWLFDSDGGFGEGVWTRDGERWIIKLTQVLQDGARASSINIINRIDDNSFSWQSTGREIDGQLHPSVESVVVVRKDGS